jgi:hypothetical protein
MSFLTLRPWATMQPATPSTSSVIHADGRRPMPINSSQGLGLSMAKARFYWRIVPSSVFRCGGRIKDFRCTEYSGTTGDFQGNPGESALIH